MVVTEEERWRYLTELHEELLKGGVVLSEWCCFIAREAEVAYAKGAHLGCVLTAVAGIETYLRAECKAGPRLSLFRLLQDAELAEDLRSDLNRLREYRNRWVHVDDPWDDDEVQLGSRVEGELEEMALFAVRCLLRTLYSVQWV